MKARAITGLALCKFLTQPAFLLTSTRHEGLLFQGEEQLRLGALGTESGEEEQTGQPGPCRLNLKAVGGVSRGAGRRRKAAGQLVAAGRDLSPRALLWDRKLRVPRPHPLRRALVSHPPKSRAPKRWVLGAASPGSSWRCPWEAATFRHKVKWPGKSMGHCSAQKQGVLCFTPQGDATLHGLMCGQSGREPFTVAVPESFLRPFLMNFR